MIGGINRITRIISGICNSNIVFVPSTEKTQPNPQAEMMVQTPYILIAIKKGNDILITIVLPKSSNIESG